MNTTSQSTFYYPVTVFYEDTDAAGVVYHANYLKFMERARTIFLQQKGIKLSDIIAQDKVQFLVRAVSISYERPAKLEQSLTVATKITKFGRASMHFSQNIFGDVCPKQINVQVGASNTPEHSFGKSIESPETLICSGDVVIVCTDLHYKPCAIPERILGELKE